MHFLTADGATTPETNTPHLPLTSQNDKSKKKENVKCHFLSTFNDELALYLYQSKYYTLTEKM